MAFLLVAQSPEGVTITTKITAWSWLGVGFGTSHPDHVGIRLYRRYTFGDCISLARVMTNLYMKTA